MWAIGMYDSKTRLFFGLLGAFVGLVIGLSLSVLSDKISDALYSHAVPNEERVAPHMIVSGIFLLAPFWSTALGFWIAFFAWRRLNKQRRHGRLQVRPKTRDYVWPIWNGDCSKLPRRRRRLMRRSPSPKGVSNVTLGPVVSGGRTDRRGIRVLATRRDGDVDRPR